MAKVKLVFTIPEKNAVEVRKVVGDAGAGRLGNYAFTSFSSKGTGRFLPLKEAKPAIGQPGKLEEVVEERIEITCNSEIVDEVVRVLKKVHPYEEPAIDIYPLI